MCRDEGVNIYNSPTMESSRDLRPSHSSIDNLAKNIYSQVQGTLISFEDWRKFGVLVIGIKAFMIIIIWYLFRVN